MFKEIMKAKLKRLLLIAASSVLLAGCCTSHYAVRQWEYKVVRNEGAGPILGDPRLDSKLAELGSEGWELASWNTSSWVFKRPKK